MNWQAAHGPQETHSDIPGEDNDFSELLTPMAMEACAIVAQIRFEEQQTIWTEAFEDDMARTSKAELYPGMVFTIARKRMESTKLWDIVRRMPKGALLHCHMDAMVDREWLIRLAMDTEGLCMGAEKALVTADFRENAHIFFQYNKSSVDKSATLFAESYVPGSLVPLHAVANAFPDGGREGFVEWVVSRLSISAEESLNHHHGPNSIWRKFTSTFRIVESLLYYEPILRQYLRRMFKDLLDDGVRYVDMRGGFPDYRKEGCETPEVGGAAVVAVLHEEIDSFIHSDEGRGFWGARLIWTALRSWDNRQIAQSK